MKSATNKATKTSKAAKAAKGAAAATPFMSSQLTAKLLALNSFLPMNMKQEILQNEVDKRKIIIKNLKTIKGEENYVKELQKIRNHMRNYGISNVTKVKSKNIGIPENRLRIAMHDITHNVESLQTIRDLKYRDDVLRLIMKIPNAKVRDGLANQVEKVVRQHIIDTPFGPFDIYEVPIHKLFDIETKVIYELDKSKIRYTPIKCTDHERRLTDPNLRRHLTGIPKRIADGRARKWLEQRNREMEERNWNGKVYNAFNDYSTKSRWFPRLSFSCLKPK